MALSTLSVSIFGFVAQLGMQISSLTVMVFLRFAIPFVIALPFLHFSKAFKNLRTQTLGMQILRAIFVLVSQYSLFYYLTSASLLNAMMLWNTTPIFIPLITWVCFGKKSAKSTWLSVILGVIGVACILKPDQGIIDTFSLWGLLAGFATAFSQVLFGENRLIERNDVNLFYLFFLTTLMSFFILVIFEVFIENEFVEVFSKVFFQGWRPYLLILILGVGSIGNQIVRGIAYGYARPASLAPFLYLSVLFSGVLDWVLYGLVPDFLFLLGAILISLGSVFRVWYAPKV